MGIFFLKDINKKSLVLKRDPNVRLRTWHASRSSLWPLYWRSAASCVGVAIFFMDQGRSIATRGKKREWMCHYTSKMCHPFVAAHQNRCAARPAQPSQPIERVQWYTIFTYDSRPPIMCGSCIIIVPLQPSAKIIRNFFIGCLAWGATLKSKDDTLWVYFLSVCLIWRMR